MAEAAGLSYGGAGAFPQYSWEIVSSEGHKHISSGDRVVLSALGESSDWWSGVVLLTLVCCTDSDCGEAGRFMCSNAKDSGASFGGDFDTGCEYGWEIVNVGESKGNRVRFGEPVYLIGVNGEGAM